MKRNILFLFFIPLILNSCHNEDNSNHNRTEEICEGLYVENYTTFGMGAGGTSMLGHCLTDSNSFRVFVGIFDEGYGGFDYNCQGDSLRVKFYSENLTHGAFHLDSTIFYRIDELKLLKNYSNDSFFKFKDLEKLH